MKNMLIIYGPTATGKTDLAIRLAKKLKGEIISADSRQVYKGLDIGTGKVNFRSKVEKHQGYWIVDGVKIHNFDLVNPGKQFSAAEFLEATFSALVRIDKVNKLPIIVGGTGFYIKGLIDGIDSIGVPANQKLRQELGKLSAEELYQNLKVTNISRAQSMNESDRANPRRLIRAIEVAAYQNRPLLDKRELTRDEYLLMGLTAPNDYLYKRADKWLEERLQKGLMEEVKSLLAKKVDPLWLENLGLEYRWLSRLALGKIGNSQAIERLKGDIHSFIRRQKTWFKKFDDIKLIDITKPNWQNLLPIDILNMNGRIKNSDKSRNFS